MAQSKQTGRLSVDVGEELGDYLQGLKEDHGIDKKVTIMDALNAWRGREPQPWEARNDDEREVVTRLLRVLRESTDPDAPAGLRWMIAHAEKDLGGPRGVVVPFRPESEQGGES